MIDLRIYHLEVALMFINSADVRLVIGNKKPKIGLKLLIFFREDSNFI